MYIIEMLCVCYLRFYISFVFVRHFPYIGAHLMTEQIDHPILITECVCNPFQSRSKMAELLFDTYGVPSIGKV